MCALAVQQSAAGLPFASPCITLRSSERDQLSCAQARAASGGTSKKAAGDEPWLGHGLKRAPGVAKEVFEVMRDMIRKASDTPPGRMLCSSFYLTLFRNYVAHVFFCNGESCKCCAWLDPRLCMVLVPHLQVCMMIVSVQC